MPEAPRLPRWLSQRLAVWLKGRPIQDVALAVSAIPMALPAPVLALAMFGIALYRRPGRETLRDWKYVPLIALLNLMISTWIWGQLGDWAGSSVLDIIRNLRWPHAPQLGSPAPIPV